MGFIRRPYGAPGGLSASFPALKRWANEHCAYGARADQKMARGRIRSRRAGGSEAVELTSVLHATALAKLVVAIEPSPGETNLGVETSAESGIFPRRLKPEFILVHVRHD
jgi:hypothetical protein